MILVPLGCLMLMLTALNNLNIGIRYLLPIYPLLYLLVAATIAHTHFLKTGMAAIVLVGIGAVTALWSHPDHLAYFNWLAGGTDNGYRVLLDSNLDWGQDLYRVKPCLDRMDSREKIGLLYFGHVDPHLYGINYTLVPPYPARAVIVVSVNFLMGFPYLATAENGQWVPIEPDHLAWLRAHQPTARLGSIWIYDLRGNAAQGERSIPSAPASSPST
jgi:hypothetical protein